MLVKDRYSFCLNFFDFKYPNPKTELNYKSNYQLLIAVILSAQCTDKRVNLVTPILFDKYKDFNSLSKAGIEDVFDIIKSISYPRNKAKYLLGCANIVSVKHNNNVPDSFDDLINLPGVGRKTANVILSILFNKPNMPVDTHVFRVSKRIGLVPNNSSLLKVENHLVNNIPVDKINKAHHWLIIHGRYVCTALKPKCNSCGIQKVCKYYHCS
ncbi:MAG: endonuclease III [Flavobacteriales bacterium]|nr:endonuclease III [Flavobacteriales bacterium]